MYGIKTIYGCVIIVPFESHPGPQARGSIAVAELKVWQVPKTKHFPEGIKYSLFLVNKESGVVLIGHDNHKPKGHHVHVGETERAYSFQGVDTLIDDFWSKVEERGYLT